MQIRSLSALAGILLMSCNGSSLQNQASTEYSAIMEAVLAAQPDNAKLRREFIAEYPDEGSVFDGLFDHRLCIAHETVGSEGDFEREVWDENDVPPSFDVYSERWVKSKKRRVIPTQSLPSHLRWDSFWSLCPSGVLRFGNPDIQSETATVYVENMSNVHGYANEITLQKIAGVWVVKQETNWWQA